MIKQSNNIAVLMCVYNAKQYLIQSIESILNQTYQNFDFLIVDDGSTDGSEKIIDYYKNIDDRIKLIRHENIGLTKSLNTIISNTNYIYYIRQDADDISIYNRVELLVENIIDKGIDLGFSFYSTFNDNFEQENKDVIRKEDDFIKFAKKFVNPVAHGSIIISKNIIKKNDGYNDHYYTSQDFELLIRLFSSKLNFKQIENVLYKVRIHNHQVSRHKLSSPHKLIKTIIIDFKLMGLIFKSFNFFPLKGFEFILRKIWRSFRYQ